MTSSAENAVIKYEGHLCTLRSDEYRRAGSLPDLQWAAHYKGSRRAGVTCQARTEKLLSRMQCRDPARNAVLQEVRGKPGNRHSSIAEGSRLSIMRYGDHTRDTILQEMWNPAILEIQGTYPLDFPTRILKWTNSPMFAQGRSILPVIGEERNGTGASHRGHD